MIFHKDAGMYQVHIFIYWLFSRKEFNYYLNFVFIFVLKNTLLIYYWFFHTVWMGMSTVQACLAEM